MKPRIKAVLFDHDGTLVDSEGAHFQQWAQVLARYDVALTQDDYFRDYAGMPTRYNAANIVEKFNLEIAPATLADAKNVALRAYLSQRAHALMPGAREVIEHLFNRGLQIAIVTGASRLGVDATVETYSLRTFVATIVCGDDVLRSKPAPDAYNLALHRLAVNALECIAVEDTEVGVKAATSAGIPCIAVPQSTSALKTFSGSTQTLRSLVEVVHWIEKTYSLPVQFTS